MEVAAEADVRQSFQGTFTITPTEDYVGVVGSSYHILDGLGGDLGGVQDSFTLVAPEPSKALRSIGVDNTHNPVTVDFTATTVTRTFCRPSTFETLMA